MTIKNWVVLVLLVAYTITIYRGLRLVAADAGTVQTLVYLGVAAVVGALFIKFIILPLTK